MRIAELVTALVLALLSLAIMWKSGEAPWGAKRFSNVGFNDAGAPAGGFWPFWVALIMLGSSVCAFGNGFLTILPVDSMNARTRKIVLGLFVVATAYPAYGLLSVLWQISASDDGSVSANAILIGHALFTICGWLIVMMVVFFLFCMLAASRDQRRSAPYLDMHGVKVLLTVAVPVILLVLLTDIISMYFSMALFVFYYLLILGRHGLILSVAMALVLPFWMYLFFDITMTTTLPKGALFMENAIYAPLGTWFRNAGASVVALCFLGGGAVIVGAALLSSRRAS